MQAGCDEARIKNTALNETWFVLFPRSPTTTETVENEVQI